MAIDKKKLYIVSILTLAILLCALFLSIEGRYAAACLLAPIAISTWFLIRKKEVKSIFSRQVLMIMTAIGLMYLIWYYISGLYFGFYKTLYPLSFKNLIRYILPISIIIFSTEVIRFVIRAQESKFCDVISYFICVVAEVLTCSSLVSITTHTRFMDMVGLTFLPAIISNLLFHYLTKRYGMFPIISYRAITVLYLYIIPIKPKMPDSLFSFISLIIPIIIYAIIDGMYERKVKYAAGKFKRTKKVASIALTVACAIIMCGTVMLISNQFKYGVLVIATDSMTGELNKGDAAIFESYDDQLITVGQVIIFERGRSMVVHRVVDIEIINGEYRFYTKGDANNSNDDGYVTESNIVGLVKSKIPYFGYPTVWLNDLF